MDMAVCDELAQNTFMEMAQLPHNDANVHANQIVSYLLSKDVTGPSKLVHKWSLDAFKKVKAKLR